MRSTSAVDDGDRPGPARRRALDLGREAGHGEPDRRQRFEIVQLLDMAVPNVPARLVALPDDRRVVRLGVAPCGVQEGRIPAPAVDPGDPDAPLEQIERRLPETT